MLSVGERQLIALARAYVANPDLLLLDEATSAVDPATEVRLQRALEGLTRGRTTIAIAHRLSTAEAADDVLVFDRGVIVQRGHHRDCCSRPAGSTPVYMRAGSPSRVVHGSPRKPSARLVGSGVEDADDGRLLEQALISAIAVVYSPSGLRPPWPRPSQRETAAISTAIRGVRRRGHESRSLDIPLSPAKAGATCSRSELPAAFEVLGINGGVGDSDDHRRLLAGSESSYAPRPPVEHSGKLWIQGQLDVRLSDVAGRNDLAEAGVVLNDAKFSVVDLEDVVRGPGVAADPVAGGRSAS